MISDYTGLQLKRQNQHLTLLGDELSRRKLYKDLLITETKGNFLNLDNLDILYENIDLVQIKEVLLKVISNFNYRIREVDILMIVIHIGVSIERILNYNYINSNIVESQILDLQEYSIAKEFFNEISKINDIKVSDDEVMLLAMLLLNKNGKTLIKNEKEGTVCNLVALITENISSSFDIDFANDVDFISGIKSHLTGLLGRLENNIHSENVFLDQVKKRYPLIFEMSLYASKIIEEETNYIVNENESGFIALHLGASYEKLNTKSLIKAILILPYNKDIVVLCKSKIDCVFSDRLEITDILNFYEEEKIKQINPDIILTTVDIQPTTEIPIVSISMFVNSEDESAIFRALNKIKRKRYEFEFQATISRLIKSEYFYTDLDLKTENEVIAFMCGELAKDKIVDENFVDNVIKREKMSTTSFSFGVAIPHAFDLKSHKSVISIAILKNSISWGGYETKLVILLATDGGNQNTLRIFFDFITTTGSDTQKFQKLLSCKTHEEFLNKIIE